MRFSIGALSAAGAGPMTMAALVKLDASTDGALIHLLTSGNASCAFLEVFGTFDYGTGATARTWSSTGAVGNWWIVIASKQSGTASVEYTTIPLGGAATSGTAAGGTLGDGSLPGASGIIQLGRFQVSGTEYVFGQYAAAAIWTSYKNQAAREALTTWAAWVAAAPQWYTRFDAITTRSDLSGNGGNETARFGTTSITLTTDPSGFFATDPVDTSGGSGSGSSTETVANGITRQDASGGSSSGGTTDTGATTITFQDTSGGSGSGGTTDTGATTITVVDGSGGSGSGSSTDAGLSGVVRADTSGGSSSGGATETAGSGTVAQDTSGGSGSGSSTEPAPSVGIVRTDTSGGSGSGSGADTAASGVVVADTSGGSSSGGAAETTGSGTFVSDTSGGSGSGSSTTGVVSGAVAQDGSGGSGSGSSPVGVVSSIIVSTTSGGSGSGGSYVLVITNSDVTIQDTSGGSSSGGSPDTPGAQTVRRDTMVMPVLLSALACLQTEAGQVENPPALYTIRPGDSFEPSADPWTDECCEGVGWARMVSSYETYEFPEPATAVQGNCAPHSWAVVIEVGINRCVPVAGDHRGSVVTTAQWLAAAQAQADDGAALRRTLCCLRELYDVADVTAGQVNPLPLQANCGGVVLQITVRRNACDCADQVH